MFICYMKTITEQFGERLKKIRTQKSLSQEQLSYLADIDRSYISDVERGARNISLENIYKLASALNIPPYLLLLNSANLLDRWDITLEELDELILKNSSLRGFVSGYLAESKIRRFFKNDSRVSQLIKFDDHDRKNKHDLVVTYKGQNISFEIKSLQTKTVRQSILPNIAKEASFQCDASDKRKISLSNGESIETTCLRCGDFDILAVNLFAFNERWEYAFALNRDLPRSQHKKYPEEIRKQLIKSIIPITYPLQPPFVADPFVLLDQIVSER